MYRAILTAQPYAVKGLVTFGTDVLMGNGDPLQGKAALEALDFYVHVDLFANPSATDANVTAEYAKEDGTVVTRNYIIGAHSRFSVWVDSVPGLIERLPSVQTPSNGRQRRSHRRHTRSGVRRPLCAFQLRGVGGGRQ